MSLVAPELAGRVLGRALAHGGDLAELYAEDRQGFALSLDEGRVEAPQSGREAGSACAWSRASRPTTATWMAWRSPT